MSFLCGYRHPWLTWELFLSGVGLYPSPAAVTRHLPPNIHQHLLKTTTTASLHFRGSKASFKAFPTGVLHEFVFQAHRIPELCSAPQIILHIHPLLLHPTLLPAKPLTKFPLSLIVLSYSLQSLAKLYFLSPSINRNKQVKKVLFNAALRLWNLLPCENSTIKSFV